LLRSHLQVRCNLPDPEQWERSRSEILFTSTRADVNFQNSKLFKANSQLTFLLCYYRRRLSKFSNETISQITCFAALLSYLWSFVHIAQPNLLLGKFGA